MIIAIRKSFKSNTYKIFLWLVILALAGVFSIPQLIRDMRTSDWIAQINGSKVSYAEFIFRARSQEARIQMLRQQYGQLADMLLQSLGASADPRVFALESLVRDELLIQVAQSMKLRVSPAFVTEKLASPLFIQQELSDLVPMFVLDPYHGINAQALRAYLQRMRISMSDFEQKVDQVLERRTLLDIVDGALYVPEFVVKERYQEEYLAKNYSLLHFNFGNYRTKAQQTPVGDEQLKEFFEQKNNVSKQYWMPEQRAGKVWEFGMGSYGVAVDDDIITSYYHEHKKNEFLEEGPQVQVRRILLKADHDTSMQAVYEQAQKLHAELINSPAAFAEKAREFSQDEATAQQGGLMPLFSRGTHHKAFDRAAFLLQNDGDISEVIVTDAGAEIIQRVSKKAATYKSLKSVYKDIEKTLKLKKFKEQFAQEAQKAVSGELAVDQLAKKAVGSVRDITLVSRDDASAQNKALFRIKQQGDYGFYVDGDKGYLVQLVTLNKPYLPSFESLKDTVSQDYYQEKAMESLQRDLARAKELAKAGDFAQLAKQFGASLKTPAALKKSDAEEIARLQKEGLPVDAMFSITVPGGVGEAKVDLDGFIVRLETIAPFDDDEFAQEKDKLKKQLQSEYKRLLGAGFVASLSRNATIKVNESLLTATR